MVLQFSPDTFQNNVCKEQVVHGPPSAGQESKLVGKSFLSEIIDKDVEKSTWAGSSSTYRRQLSCEMRIPVGC